KRMALADSNTVSDGFQSNYQAGNEADFERLYASSYGRILGTLTAMLGDRSAAEDCAQDAFERAYKKWPTWQPLAPAEAWVHRIAVNAAVSYSAGCDFARSVRSSGESAARALLPILKCWRRTAI